MGRQPLVRVWQAGAALALLGALTWFARTTQRAFDAYQANSDFKVVVEAGRLVWRGVSAYRPFDQGLDNAFQTGSTSISYPPSAFLVLAPWIAIPDPWRSLSWLVIQYLALAVIIGGCYLAIGRPRAAEAMLAIAICLALYPVRDNLGEGQFGLVLVALTVVALLAHERGSAVIGGVALGLAIALKLTPVLVLPFFLYLRGYRLLGWTAVTVAVVLGATLLLGWGARWFEYLQQVGPLGRGTALNANQSLNGVLLRIWRPDLVGQPISPLPLWFRAVWYAGDLVIVAGVVQLVRRVGVDSAINRWACLGVVLTATALVEPFAWIHHLVGLTILVVVAARLVSTREVGTGVTTALLALALFLSLGSRYTILLPSETSLRLPLPALTTSLTFLATAAAAVVIVTALPAGRAAIARR